MSKCTLQSLHELHGAPKMMVISCTHFTLESTPIFLKLLLLLPAALEVLISDVTFFCISMTPQ